MTRLKRLVMSDCTVVGKEVFLTVNMRAALIQSTFRVIVRIRVPHDSTVMGTNERKAEEGKQAAKTTDESEQQQAIRD
jgi:hypothetical protein